MRAAPPNRTSWSAPAIAAAFVAAALVATYANHFHNSFHFDDAHTIVNNASIQELRNVPLFFRDATSFSSLPSNQSYRPLVSTLLALDYWLGGGLNPVWFHVSVFALFVLLVLLIAFVVRRLLDDAEVSPRNGWIALGAAACYGLHPANADTVNYIIACSEVLSTLGVVASFAIYFAFPQWRRYYFYVVPATAATLAKPPAAAFALLFAIYRLVFADNDRARWKRSAFADTWPSFVACGGMLWFVQAMTPHTWVAGAADARRYLMTQPYVALLYFKTFFWPSGLSADYDLDPLTTTNDARFWIGCAFVLLLSGAAILAVVHKKTRVIGFGLIWFVVALLSTSALPLAEVMNDHRTFFPYIGLVIALAGAASLLLDRLLAKKRANGAVAGAVALLLMASAYATRQRNAVWRTEESLWHDVVMKSPRNGRGLMNYGNTLMARGDYKAALEYFDRARAFVPRYSLLFINLAIAEDATGDVTAAEKDFSEALRLAPSGGDSYTFYGRYLLAHGRALEAREFLRTALELSPGDVTARRLIARAEAQAIAEPITETAESHLARSLRLYREGRYVESVVACRLALALRPDYAEAWNNIGAADNKLGRYKEAAGACEEALSRKPDFELARNNLQYAREQAARGNERRQTSPRPATPKH